MLHSRSVLPALASLVFLCAGCQPALEYSAEDHPMKRCAVGSGGFSFMHPAGLKRVQRSSDPLGFYLTDAEEHFAISVVWGPEGVDAQFVAEMIALSIEGVESIGQPEAITIGSATGLSQTHRQWDRYGYRRSKTIIVTNANERLIFEIAYAENYETQLGPLVQRVVDSLSHKDNFAIQRGLDASPAT